MSDEGPGNTLRERVGSRRDRFRLQFLLNVNRLTLTALLAVGLFVFLMILGVLDVTPLRAAMEGGKPVVTIFRALTTSVITSVTLVITISQLVLSQETGPLGDQRARMQGAIEFREDVEGLFGATSPPEPSSFLRALVDTSSDAANALCDAVSDNNNDDLREHVNEFVDDITGNADAVSDELENAQFGQYEVVRAALDYNYSWKIYKGRRLHQKYEDDLSDDEQEALEDVIEVLTFFGPAREHIKTLYFQWELVNLSRSILYVAIPALAVSGALFLFLDVNSFPGTTFSIDNILWVVSAGFTVAVTPFLLLAAYILRIATIAKRTLAIGPFILRDSEREQDIDWGS